MLHAGRRALCVARAHINSCQQRAAAPLLPTTTIYQPTHSTMADQQNNPNPAQGGAYQQDGLDKVRRVCYRIFCTLLTFLCASQGIDAVLKKTGHGQSESTVSGAAVGMLQPSQRLTLALALPDREDLGRLPLRLQEGECAASGLDRRMIAIGCFVPRGWPQP